LTHPPGNIKLNALTSRHFRSGDKQLRHFVLPLLMGSLLLQPSLFAQTKAGAPFRPNANLTAQEKSGERLFFQRCSLCHVPQYSKTSAVSDLPPVYISLDGLFKDADAGMEATARTFIMNGTQRMPAFKYGLKPEEIDSVIAYLKTLPKNNVRP
jgi:mono/diheme cytochrome c family protein